MLEQEQALRQVLAADRKTCHLVPSWQDIEVLESVNKALSPLAEFTDILSGEEYVTVSSLRPLLQHLTETILKEEEDDTRLTKDIKSHVMTNLSQRYEDTQVSELANMAMILDPRFKSDYLDDNAEAVKEQVVLEETIVASRMEQPPLSTDESENVEPPAKRKRLGSLLKNIWQQPGSPSVQLPPEERVKAEMEAYLRAPNTIPSLTHLIGGKCRTRTTRF